MPYSSQRGRVTVPWGLDGPGSSDVFPGRVSASVRHVTIKGDSWVDLSES
jgi:hypothetical protein